MAKESIEDLVKKVVEEICENNKNLDINRPFSIVVYDPQQPRELGLMATRDSLKSAVRTLYQWTEREPLHIGEILLYKPKTKVIYTKTPTP
jgi:hypothetical protein